MSSKSETDNLRTRHSEECQTEIQLRDRTPGSTPKALTQTINLPQDQDFCKDGETDITTSPVLIFDVSYPEGGFQAWLVVFGSFCGITAAFGFMNSREL
jgi:hypothetical protein